MLTINRTYFCWALGLFGIELYIGLCVHDALVRPFGGDFLVVMLLYCLLRALGMVARHHAASAVLLVAVATEVSQYYHLIQWVGWEQHLWARLLLGSHFAWADLLAYAAGIVVVLAVEQSYASRQSRIASASATRSRNGRA